MMWLSIIRTRYILYYLLLVPIKSTEAGPQKDLNTVNSGIYTEEISEIRSIGQIDDEIIFFNCSVGELAEIKGESDSKALTSEKRVRENINPSSIERTEIFTSSLFSLKKIPALNPKIKLVNIISVLRKKVDAEKSDKKEEKN